MRREYIAKSSIDRVARRPTFRHKKTPSTNRRRSVCILLSQRLRWLLEDNRVCFIRVLTHFMEVQVTVSIGSGCINLLCVR